MRSLRNIGQALARKPGTRFPALRPLPTAWIHRAEVQAGRGGRAFEGRWVLEFEPVQPSLPDPLIGWSGGGDALDQGLRLTFPDLESAIEFAESRGWSWAVSEPPVRPLRPKSYAETLKSAARAGSSPLALRSGGGSASLQDPVEEAELESFPASDPPAWTGASIP